MNAVFRIKPFKEKLFVLYLKYLNNADMSVEPYNHSILSANSILVADKEGRYTPSIQTLERNHLKWLTPPHLSICISAVLNGFSVILRHVLYQAEQPRHGERQLSLKSLLGSVRKAFKLF